MWFSDELGSVMAGLGDLKGLFQSEWFYNSIIMSPQKCGWRTFEEVNISYNLLPVQKRNGKNNLFIAKLQLKEIKNPENSSYVRHTDACQNLQVSYCLVLLMNVCR